MAKSRYASLHVVPSCHVMLHDVTHLPADIDECTIRNPCEQGCRNMQGRYMCYCYVGFTLMTDGRACRPLHDYSKSPRRRCCRNEYTQMLIKKLHLSATKRSASYRELIWCSTRYDGSTQNGEWILKMRLPCVPTVYCTVKGAAV